MKLSVYCLKEKFEANLTQICKALEINHSLFSIKDDLTRKLWRDLAELNHSFKRILISLLKRRIIKTPCEVKHIVSES